MTQPPQPPNQPDQPPNQPGQPPQPPNQPPQAPPSGGFGAPIPPQPEPQPQGQPGYGYPQQPQPPHQYPTQPQYGQPQYGQPQYGQPPYGQPPYGQQYPTQPPQSGPGGPGGGRKKLSAQAQIIIAAAVAVVLIVGAGVWFASSGGDSDNKAKGGSSGATDGGKGGDGGTKGLPAGKEKAPADVKATSAFNLPMPTLTVDADVQGSWLTDTTYVKTGINQIVGYDLAKGTQLWTIPLPGQVCAASKHVKDNITAIAFEANKRTASTKYQACTQIGAIDLKAGRLLWSKGGDAKSGDTAASFGEVTIGASTVAAGGTDGGVAFDLETGKQLWKPEIDANGCYDMGYGGGDAALVAARKCGGFDSQTVTIENLNPLTGAVLSSFKMPDGVEYASVISAKPLVVAADVGDTAGDGSGISDYFSIDEKTGKLRAKIPADADQYGGQCDPVRVEACQQVVVGNNKLYVATEPHDPGGEDGGLETNELVSFDLATGKSTTDRALAGKDSSIFPLRMDGGNVIVYKEPPYGTGRQIVSIDGSTFKPTVLLETPSDEKSTRAQTNFSPDYSEFLYGSGHFFMSETLLSKTDKPTADDPNYLAMAYSAS
ncbi:outer membrane protein assembly factor BamB family protein [Streptomyces sp. NBC_00370]|uniref:outer membrane protein assembly factor BamB family protein n=1 Tax=Streptomyces sp. NBC_00370 TaxID=2975728 RepID=UPI002E26FDC4